MDRNSILSNVILVNLVARINASSENPPANICTISFEKILLKTKKIIDITKRMLTTLFAKLYISF